MPHVRSILCVCVCFLFLWLQWSFLLHALGEEEETTAGREHRGHIHPRWNVITHTVTHSQQLSSSCFHIFPSYNTHELTQRHTLLSFRTHIHTFCHFSHSSFCPHSHADIYASIFLNLTTRTYSLTPFLTFSTLPLTCTNIIIRCQMPWWSQRRREGGYRCGWLRVIDNVCLCHFQRVTNQLSVCQLHLRDTNSNFCL